MQSAVEHNEDFLAALRHSMRRQILTEMAGAEGPVSPVELSQRLRHPLSNVSYHVRVLSDLGVIELVDTQPVRGSVRHSYLPGPALRLPWVRIVLKLPALDNDDSNDG